VRIYNLKMKIDVPGKELVIIEKFFPWDICSYRDFWFRVDVRLL